MTGVDGSDNDNSGHDGEDRDEQGMQHGKLRIMLWIVCSTEWGMVRYSGQQRLLMRFFPGFIFSYVHLNDFHLSAQSQMWSSLSSSDRSQGHFARTLV